MANGGRVHSGEGAEAVVDESSHLDSRGRKRRRRGLPVPPLQKSAERRHVAVARGVVGNESTGVSFSGSAAARQPASSSLVSVPTFLSLAPSLSLA